MIRGLYTAASGMISTMMGNDTVANNIANLNTTGFKRNQYNVQSFPEMLISKMSDNGKEAMGSISTGSKVRDTRIDFEQGALTQTGNTFDIALKGDGFFTLKSPTGEESYTRAGMFTVNQDGYLTTTRGDFVQGELGNILLSLDEGPFSISEKGVLTAKDRVVDTLKITRFEDNGTLVKVGKTSFGKSEITYELPPAKQGEFSGYTIHQGMLEQSNTNAISELVRSIEGMRLYEALQKNIQMQNQATGKAVNDVGRYRG